MVDAVAFRFLLLFLACWVHRQQQDVIEFLKAENRVLRVQLDGRHVRLTDDQRRRLAVRAKTSLGSIDPLRLPTSIRPTVSLWRRASHPRGRIGENRDPRRLSLHVARQEGRPFHRALIQARLPVPHSKMNADAEVWARVEGTHPGYIRRYRDRMKHR
jgi:hypothetical protein